MKIRSLNYPHKYKYENVNLIITDAYSQSAIQSNHISRITTSAVTARIEQFIRKNPDFSNLLPLNEPFGKRNIDIQLTWTALNRLTVVVRNFKEITIIEEDGEEWQGDFESWVDDVLGKELYGEKPWVIWETPARWNRTTYDTYIDYERSAWPHANYVEHFDPCGSCGITITENTDNQTSCMECGTSIHGDGDCGPWLDHGQDGGSGNYETAMCVACYEDATGEEYGGYNRLRSGFSQRVAKRITDEDIRQTLTFIEETFNTFEWR